MCYDLTAIFDRNRAVFLSYAHADNESADPKQRWLDRFLQFLRPLVRQEALTVWSDQEIKIGDDWNARIQAQLHAAKAVVLLVSPAFLASDYIVNNELPVLLKKAADQGVKIMPIIISPCLFKRTKFKYPDPVKGPQEFTLASIQAANAPTRTLVEMNEGEQNRVLLEVAEQLADLLGEIPPPAASESAAAVVPLSPEVSSGSVSGGSHRPRDPRDYIDGTVRRVATALHETKTLTMRQLIGQLNELFNRSTFRFEPLRECLTQEWGARLHAAMQTLEVLRFYSPFVSEHAAAPSARTYEKLMDEVNHYCQRMAVHLFAQVVEISLMREVVGTSEFTNRLPSSKKFEGGVDKETDREVDGPRVRAIKQMDHLRKEFFKSPHPE